MANPKVFLRLQSTDFGETEDNDNSSFKSISRKDSSSSNFSLSSSSSVSEDGSPPPPINFNTRPPASASLSNSFPKSTNGVGGLLKQAPRPPHQTLVTAISSDSSSSSSSDVDEFRGQIPSSRKSSDSSENDVEEYVGPVTPYQDNNNKTQPEPPVPKYKPPPPPSSSSSSENEEPPSPKQSTFPNGTNVVSPNRNDFSSDQSVDEYIPPPIIVTKETSPKPVFQPVLVVNETEKPKPPVTKVQPVVTNAQPVITNVQPVISKVQPPITNAQPVISKVQPPITNAQPVISKVQPVITNVQPPIKNAQPVISKVQPGKTSPFPNERREKESDQLRRAPPNPNMNKVDPLLPSRDNRQYDNRSSPSSGTEVIKRDVGSTRTSPTISTINLKNQEMSSESSELRKPKDGELIYSWLNLNVRLGPEEKVISEDVEKGGCFGLKKKPVSKVILQNVTGIVYPGQLVAVMGASGAGKTTLLNVLTFRNTRNLNVSGDIFVNGVPVKNTETLSSISAYVQQDDLFVGTLTVREHLIFQARLRMDRHLSFSERVKRVDEVIGELGLTKCRDTLIGIPGRIKGISGGEMKRLSFASEVLTNPSLMFCDEPTSGLDSYMAGSVVSVLKQMAMKGKTIVCTIHQPSSEVYDMFDRLLLMAEGRVAYLGDTKQVIPFFRELQYECPLHFNPADFFIQTLAIRPNDEAEKCKKKVHGICNAYENTLGKKTRDSVERINRSELDHTRINQAKANRSPYKASWFEQMRTVFWRCWKTQFKDPMIAVLRIATTLFIGLLVGIIYLRQDYNQEGIMNINGAMFLLLTNITFQNVFGVVNVFAAELPVFYREHYNGMYSTGVYFLCKTFSELPFFIVLPFLLTTIVYWMVGLNDDIDRYFIACGIVTLVTNIACSFGYMISCISSSLNMALAMGPPLIIPFLLFGGFFLNSGSIPVWLVWVKYISWFHYGNEALSINQWDDTAIECNRASNSSCITDGNQLLENLGYNKDNLILDCCMLVVLLVAFRIIGFLGILFKTYRAR